MLPRPECESQAVLLDPLEQVQSQCPDSEAEKGVI